MKTGQRRLRNNFLRVLWKPALEWKRTMYLTYDIYFVIVTVRL